MKKTMLVVFMIFCFEGMIFAQEPEQKFQGFNLQGYTEDGEKAWDVKSDTADIEGSKTKLSNIDANTYGDDKTNLTADTGTIDQAGGQMHLEENVVITREDGTRLLTDSLDWDREEDLVTTDDKVMIMDERMTVKGKGMEAKPGLKTAKIEKDVTVMVDTEDEEEAKSIVTITCDGPLEIDQAQSKAIFNENVFAMQKDRTLRADKMEVYFDEENQQIKQMVCIGHVMIEQGENKTFAEKAVYNATTQKITLYGKPKLIFVTEGDDAITSIGD